MEWKTVYPGIWIAVSGGSSYAVHRRPVIGNGAWFEPHVDGSRIGADQYSLEEAQQVCERRAADRAKGTI